MGAAIPEGAHPQPPGRREGAPTPRPLPSQPRLSLPRSRRFGFRKWGGGCHGNVPPSIATAPGGARGGFRDQSVGAHNLPVGISAAAERSNSRSRSRSPGGTAAAATAAAAAHWDPLGSTALAMSGTCLRLAAVAASRARADS